MFDLFGSIYERVPKFISKLDAYVSDDSIWVGTRNLLTFYYDKLTLIFPLFDYHYTVFKYTNIIIFYLSKYNNNILYEYYIKL